MKWRLIIEEFNPELHYIKGKRNVVADALSRHDFDNDISEKQMCEMPAFEDDDVSDDYFPLTYQFISQEKKKDKKLLLTAKDSKEFKSKEFLGGGKPFFLNLQK